MQKESGIVAIAHTKDGKHYTGEAECQPLYEHLQNVSSYAKKFSKAFGAESVGEVIGLLHDYGKYTKAFQDRIRGKKIKAPHAMLGAVLLAESKDPFLFLYGMAVAGHHTGLQDSGNRSSAGDGTYQSNIKEIQENQPNDSMQN